MPVHLRNQRGNIVSALRRNQELEREKRLVQRISLDPSSEIRTEVIQLSRPVNVRRVGSIAKPISIKNQVATTNISPQQKNIQDLKRAFPPSVSSVIDRGTSREIESIENLPSVSGFSIPKATGFETETILSTQAGGSRIIRGSEALQNRVITNVARTRFNNALKDLQSTINQLSSIFNGGRT